MDWVDGWNAVAMCQGAPVAARCWLATLTQKLFYADTAGMSEPTARYWQLLKSGLVEPALSVHVVPSKTAATHSSLASQLAVHAARLAAAAGEPTVVPTLRLAVQLQTV